MSHTVALLVERMATAYMCCQFKESEGENLEMPPHVTRYRGQRVAPPDPNM